jgi:hypothetical protein
VALATPPHTISSDSAMSYGAVPAPSGRSASPMEEAPFSLPLNVSQWQGLLRKALSSGLFAEASVRPFVQPFAGLILFQLVFSALSLNPLGVLWSIACSALGIGAIYYTEYSGLLLWILVLAEIGLSIWNAVWVVVSIYLLIFASFLGPVVLGLLVAPIGLAYVVLCLAALFMSVCTTIATFALALVVRKNPALQLQAKFTMF